TSGPGSVSLESANSIRTMAVFSEPGIYLLRLTVSDGQLNASDEVQVTVEGADPFTAWIEANFNESEQNDPQISGPEADPDGDSFTNEQEFIAGTDPRDPASFLHVQSVYEEDDDLVIRFEIVGDKGYTILGAEDLEASEWERVLDLSPQGTT